MKIIDRAAFLALPEGVLYSKYSPHIIGQLAIKGATCGDDFYTQDVADCLAAYSSDEYFELIERAQQTGESIPLDLEYEGRDGLFDGDEVKFAVWEKGDVLQLVSRLLQLAVFRPAPTS